MMENRPPEFITDPAELGALLGLPEPITEEARLALDGKTPDSSGDAPRLRIPKSLLSRMERGNGADPILLQFLPRLAELETVPGFCDDPLGEFGNTAENDGSETSLDGETGVQTCRDSENNDREPSRASGDDGRFGPLLQKYVGRVLILTGGGCAANCRFCFRRHAPKENNLFAVSPNREKPSEEKGSVESRLAPIFESLKSDSSLREIILSGGDPLGLSDRKLTLLFDYIMTLPFVKRVRVHTRYPVLIPERMTETLLRSLARLRESGKTPVVVFHLNHPAEINGDVARMFGRLASVGGILLSQTVLLRGINDDPATLATLFEKEGAFSVLPYYLHQLDRVAGAAHFEVTPARGREIIQELRRILPGYLVPRYVREIPGAPAKTPME